MSDKYELTGEIILINDTQAFPSGFTKREFVVKTNEKYPQDVKLETVKEGCDKLDQFRIGDQVTASFNVRGNEHNGRYFVSLQAWKITPTDAPQGQREPQGRRSSEFGQRETSQNGATPPTKGDDFDDDTSIPF